MSDSSKPAARPLDHLGRILQAIEWLPIRRTLRAYDRERWRRDLRAGLNVALLAFPQGLAYAMIAGVPVSFGLFGSAIACLIGPLFAGSRFIMLGPTNATAVLTLSAFLAAGASETQLAGLVPLLLIMVAVLQIVAAHFNIANLIAYISRSVIIGYISAAAVLIIANQLRSLLGVTAPDASTLAGVLQGTLAEVRNTDLPTVAVAAATATVYLALRRWAPRWPGVVITLVASILLGLAATHLGHPVRMLPAVDVGSWHPTLPSGSFEDVHRLASAALAIAFLGILEGTSIGKTLAARAGERLPANQEVFSMGMANLGCAFLGGMAASGSLTRSVLGVSSGAATPAASLVCGTVSLGLVIGLGQFVDLVPKASLAVVVVFVALSLVQPRQIRFVVRSTPGDATVFAVTAGAALVFPLDFAIFLGTATSIVLYLRKAGEPDLVEYAFTPEGQLAEARAQDAQPLPEISIVHVEGSLFFGAAELLQEQVRRACEDPNLRIIILRLKHAHHLDASAILALEELVLFMREQGRGLIVSGARKDGYRICKRTGLVDLIGRENFFLEWPQNPTLSTRNALKRAQAILGQKEAAIRVFSEMRTKATGAASP